MSKAIGANASRALVCPCVGPATLAILNQPFGLAFDPLNTTLYFAEVSNAAIRAVSPAGIISTIAGVLGGGWCGYFGNQATGVLSRLSQNVALVPFSGGFVTQDYYDQIIRSYTVATSTLSTIGGVPWVAGYSGDNGPATTARLSNPNGMASDGVGGYYIADSSNGAIRMLYPVGSSFYMTTVAGGRGGGYSYVVCVSFCSSALPFSPPLSLPCSGDGGPAINATMNFPFSIALDNSTGNIYVSVGRVEVFGCSIVSV